MSAGARDGSRFPFDLFSGTIRMWEVEIDAAIRPIQFQRRFRSALA